MRVVVVSGLLFISLWSLAQETEAEGLLLQLGDQKVLEVPELKKPVRDRMDFGLNAGAGFTSFGRYGSMFHTYLAPEIRYQAAPRVHFCAGIILSTGFMPGGGFEGTGLAAPALWSSGGNRFNRTFVYAEGTYQINQRLSIGGMVVKELDNSFRRQMNAFQKNAGFQSMGMSVNYRISDNVHVGARFNVTDGRPYYYTDPANPFLRPSPFNPGW
jgi:hypothetical protein